MANINSIVCLPGTYPIQMEEMQSFLGEWISDKAFLRKFNFLAKDNSVRLKRAFIPDYNGSHPDRTLYIPSRELPSTGQRMQKYKDIIVDICKEPAAQAIENAGLKKENITHIITVSCTGLMAPGLETLLMVALGLNDNVERHAVNFIGCYAAFHAFRLAKLITDQSLEANVLIVCAELCSLHFRQDSSDDNILSTYLFSDGVAACIISHKPHPTVRSLKIVEMASAWVKEGIHDMGWYIGEHGFEMVLNKNIPHHILSHMNDAYNSLLLKSGINGKNIQQFAIHPGGKNILVAFAEALHIEKQQLDISYDVLKEYGNMSSATILFVLKQLLDVKDSTQNNDYVYSAAFGPGLSIEQGLLQIHNNE